jgi:hypothetical protein
VDYCHIPGYLVQVDGKLVQMRGGLLGKSLGRSSRGRNGRLSARSDNDRSVRIRRRVLEGWKRVGGFGGQASSDPRRAAGKSATGRDCLRADCIDVGGCVRGSVRRLRSLCVIDLGKSQEGCRVPA